MFDRANNRLLALALLVLSAGSTSCFHKRPRARVFVPPPIAPRPPVPKQAPEVTAPPDIYADNNDTNRDSRLLELAGISVQFPPQFPRLPAPPEPRRPQAVAPPKQPPPTIVEPTPQPPRLGQIFSAEQVREYNRTLDESLERVKKILGSLGGRRLNSEQADVVNRIRTFQNQAEQARDQDLVTAVSLARRADLLAQDLIGRLP